jgi:hypothetical protein
MVSAKMANYPSRQRLIHRSAWKRNSRKSNFAFKEFSEVVRAVMPPKMSRWDDALALLGSGAYSAVVE